MHFGFEGTYTESRYDAAGRLAEQRFFDNEIACANGTGAPAEVVSFTYDAFGRRTRAVRTDAVGTILREETWAYDAEGRLTRVESPEGAVNYRYDALGRLVRTFTGTEAAPVHDTLYGYDAADRLALVTAVRRDGVTLAVPEQMAYRHDALGRLVREDKPDGTVTTYGYDVHGRVVRVTHFAPDATPEDLSDNARHAEYLYDLRADGKRDAATETVWDGGVAKTTEVDWEYDEAGRLLLEEVFNDYDDLLERIDSFTYDLAGNRTEFLRDYVDPTKTDEQTTSGYDANDRLRLEQLDRGNDGTIEQETEYSWTGTRQTRKTVEEAGVRTSETTYGYDLRGRMTSVVQETFAADGTTVTQRETTTHGYDSAGTLVSTSHAIDENVDGTPESVTTTVKLNDANNLTGYSQVLEEETTTAAGTKRIVYTLGTDQITQTVYDAANPDGVTHVFHTDGLVGSTRFLTALAAAVLERYSYDAHGNAIGFDPSAALTTHLFNGEPFDAQTELHYRRDRWLTDGRFLTLDAFTGNLRDPLSLHKYLYAHADAVNGVDPTGLLVSLFGTSAWGYSVEREIRAIYAANHLFDDTARSGRVTKIGPRPPRGTLGSLYYAKVDLLNKTTMKYGEIKPLSLSGITAGIAQMALRATQFSNTPYTPDTGWIPSPNVGVADGQTFAFVNIRGLVLYIDLAENAQDVAALASIELARVFVRKYAVQLALRRIPALVATTASTHITGLANRVGLSGVLASMGFA